MLVSPRISRIPCDKLAFPAPLKPQVGREFRVFLAGHESGQRAIFRIHPREAATVIFESYDELGYNYRMTDIQVAVGREQLKRLPGLLERRHKLAARYSTLLAQVHGVLVPEQPAWARTNWQSYCIYLPEGVGQREVMQAMLDAGVSTRRGIMCAHREPAYAREPWSCGSGEGRCACPGGSCERLRNSERAQERSIVLPLYDQLTESEQDRVVAASSEAVAAERRVAGRRS